MGGRGENGFVQSRHGGKNRTLDRSLAVFILTTGIGLAFGTSASNRNSFGTNLTAQATEHPNAAPRAPPAPANIW